MSKDLSLLVTTVENLLLFFSIMVAWYFSNKQLKAIRDELWLSTFSNYTKRYQEIVERLPMGAFSTKKELDKDKVDGALPLFRSYFNLCSEEFYLNRIGRLQSVVWSTWQEEMQMHFRYPAFTEAWERLRKITCYDMRFVAFVEEYMYGKKEQKAH